MISDNIAYGKNIFGISGAFTGLPEWIDVFENSATEDSVLSGYNFVNSDGVLKTGKIQYRDCYDDIEELSVNIKATYDESGFFNGDELNRNLLTLENVSSI